MEFIKLFGNALFSEDLDADDESTQYSDDPDSEESSHFSHRRRPSPKQNLVMWEDRPLQLSKQSRAKRKQRHLLNDQEIETITLKTLTQDRFYRKDCYAVYLKGEELGLSLLVRLGRVLVKGFTDTPFVLPAQACSMIAIGDELIYVGQIDLSKLDFLHLSEVIAHLDHYAKEGVQLTFKYGSLELLAFCSRQPQFAIGLQDDSFLDIIGIDKADMVEEEEGDNNVFAEVDSNNGDHYNEEEDDIPSLHYIQESILQFKSHLFHIDAISCIRQQQQKQQHGNQFQLSPMTLTTHDLQLLCNFLQHEQQPQSATHIIPVASTKHSLHGQQQYEKLSSVPTLDISNTSTIALINTRRRTSRLLSSSHIMNKYRHHIVSLTHDTIRTLLTLPTSIDMWTFISHKILLSPPTVTKTQSSRLTSQHFNNEKSRKLQFESHSRSHTLGRVWVIHVESQRKFEFPALDATYAIYYTILQNLDFYTSQTLVAGSGDFSLISEVLLQWSETFNPSFLWELQNSCFYNDPDSGSSVFGLKVLWSYASSQEEVDFSDFYYIIADLMTLTVILMIGRQDVLKINRSGSKKDCSSSGGCHNLSFHFLPLTLSLPSHQQQGAPPVDDSEISAFISRNISCIHVNIMTFLAIHLHLSLTLNTLLSSTLEILNFTAKPLCGTGSKSRVWLTSTYHELSLCQTAAGVLQWIHTYNTLISSHAKLAQYSLPFSLILVKNVLSENTWLGVELSHHFRVTPWLMRQLVFGSSSGKVVEVEKLSVYYDYLSKFIRIMDDNNSSEEEDDSMLGEFFLQVKPYCATGEQAEEDGDRRRKRKIVNELLEVALYLSNHSSASAPPSAASTTTSTVSGMASNPFDSPSPSVTITTTTTAASINSSRNKSNGKKRNAYLVCVRGLLLKPLDQLDMIDAIVTCLHYHYHDGCLTLLDKAIAHAADSTDDSSQSDSEEMKESGLFWTTLEQLSQQLSAQLLDDLRTNLSQADVASVLSAFKKQFITYLTIVYQLWYHHCCQSTTAVTLTDETNLLWRLVLLPVDRLITIIPDTDRFNDSEQQSMKQHHAEWMTIFILYEHGSHDGQVILQQMKVLSQQLTVVFLLILRQQGLITSK